MNKKIIIVLILTLILFGLGILGYYQNDNGIKKNEKDKTEDTTEQETLMNTTDAIILANELYNKASNLKFDKTLIENFTIENSDNASYDKVITNYKNVASLIVKDPSLFVNEKELYTEDGKLYIKNNTNVKRKDYVKTELQIKEIELRKISFNAMVTYCGSLTKSCTEQEVLTNYTKTKYEFSLQKIDDIWKVDTFTLAY